jgi:putative heme iron utilization protein
MTDSSPSFFANDDLPEDVDTLHAIAEIAQTLSAILPQQAVLQLLKENEPPEIHKEIHARLSSLTMVDVLDILPEAGIQHLQTFLRQKVQQVLKSYPDIQTIEARYAVCRQEMTGPNNPLLFYIRPYLSQP